MIWIAARVVLGAALVLHGLANTVWPLRAVDAVSPGVWAPGVNAIYFGAVVGFVAAGLAVLGVRPLRRLTPWDAVTGAACALISSVVQGDRDLWVGSALSIVLAVAVTVWSRVRWTREAPAAGRWWHRAGRAAGVAFLVWVAAAVGLWPHYRTWGATAPEWSLDLPGDHAPRTPQFEILYAVTIDAPPEKVWPWLMQLGQDRAGFYSYDWLERLFGADIRNVSEIRPEWPAREVGDLVPATQPGYLGGVFGERPGWKVALVQPERALVLAQWGAFVLRPEPDGRTRFLIRSTISNARIPAWAAPLDMVAFQLPHFIMQRRMMLSIKALAETHA
jgi:hypothetical protein